MKIAKDCPKCGHDDTILLYYNLGDDISGRAVLVCKKYCNEIIDVNLPTFIRSSIKEECIHLHCRTCQYDWVSEIINISEFKKSKCPPRLF